MPVDPQRLAQDARVELRAAELAYAARELERLGDTPALRKVVLMQRDALIAAICAAHLDALAGEPEGETLEKAAEAMGWEKPLACDEEPLHIRRSRSGCIACRLLREWETDIAKLRAAAPLLRAPLLAEIERMRERLDTTERFAGGLQAKLLTGDNSPAFAEVSAQLAALREAVKEWKRIASVFDPKALSKAPLEADGVTKTPRLDGRWYVVQNAVETLAYTKYPGMALVLRDLSRLILSSHAALLDAHTEER